MIEEVPTRVVPPRVLDVETQGADLAHDLKKAIHYLIVAPVGDRVTTRASAATVRLRRGQRGRDAP